MGGAATGAIIGAFTVNPGAGAAIGGGLGLLGGALIGNAMQNRENEQAQTQTQIQQQQREIQRQQYEIQALKNQQAGETDIRRLRMYSATRLLVMMHLTLGST